MWCLSKSVHVLNMECYDWISYRFPKFNNNKKKPKHCFHSNLVYAKVPKIRTDRLFLTLAFSPTFPEPFCQSLKVTTWYFLKLCSSNLNRNLCTWYRLSEIYAWNYNCTMYRWTVDIESTYRKKNNDQF